MSQPSSPEDRRALAANALSLSCSNDGSSLLEPDRSKRNIRILRWYHQADPIAALCALCALIIGALGLFDGLILEYQLKHKESRSSGYYRNNSSSRFDAPFRDADSPTDTALICFGLATALAWIAAQRANFRAVSLDANKFFFQGVEQRDLLNILTLRAFSLSWFRWRIKLWKSTLFSIAQVLLYIGIALSYRRAFRNGTVIQRVDLNTTSSRFLLGCVMGPRIDYLSIYHDLMGVALPDEQIESSRAWTRLATLPRSLTAYPIPEDWVVRVAWHGSTFQRHVTWDHADLDSEGVKTTGFHGPFLAGMVQLASNETLPANKTFSPGASIELAQHPRCGLLPRQCKLIERWPTGSGYLKTCFWTGLKVLNMTAEFTLSYQLHTATLAEKDVFLDKDQCPLRLGGSIYQSWISRAVPANCDTNPPFVTSSYEAQSFSSSQLGVFASLIAEVQKSIQNVGENLTASYSDWPQLNVSAIPDFEMLQQNGIVVANKGKMDFGLYSQFCGVPRGVEVDNAQYGLPIYTGSIRFPQVTNEWTGYQTGASVMLIIWGVILGVMAWPFKRLFIKGELDQYMSLGADVGSKAMEGASSGHWGSESNTIWRLRHGKCDGGYYRIWFEEALVKNEKEVADPRKIQTGCKYL